MSPKIREIPVKELNDIIKNCLGLKQSEWEECRRDLQSIRSAYRRPVLDIAPKKIRKRLKQIRKKLLAAQDALISEEKDFHHEFALICLRDDFDQLGDTIDLLEELALQTHVTGQALGRTRGGNVADVRKRRFLRRCWKSLKRWGHGRPTKEKLLDLAENLWKSFSGEENPSLKRAVDDLYPELHKNKSA